MNDVTSSATSVALSLKEIEADYGAGPVVQGISFDVQKGEIFGLAGLNGTGKTTLIKVILGLMPARLGEVTLFNLHHRHAAAKAKVAYLPEKFEPPPFLTALEFLSFSLALYKRSFVKEEVMAAADRVVLSRTALRRRMQTYSKGMRQKAGLLGTWLTGCPLLILDEPMSGLDPRARALVKQEIKNCQQRGMTVFMSSHILADMDEICDRVAVMHDGTLQYCGTPFALKEKTRQDTLEKAFLKKIENSQRIYES